MPMKFFRLFCAILAALALSTALIVGALRVVHCFRPALFLLPVKSALPLIFIGVAFACYQFAIPRTLSQIALGLMVSLAFVMWGSEQFLSNPPIVALIDDMVVLLFVLDLCIVMYRHLKPPTASVRAELTLDAAKK